MTKNYSKLKLGIIDYIKYYKVNNPESLKPPSIETCIQYFIPEYSREEIANNLDKLIDDGVVYYYSFHGYLTLTTTNTETFKSRGDGD